MIGLPEYVELHCLSNFTFLRGASHPAELVQQALTLGYRALALTDECTVAGLVRAHLAAKDAGLKLIAGSELLLEDGSKLVALATDRQGYGNLCEIITLGRRHSKKGTYRLARAALSGSLSGCLVLWIPADNTEGNQATGQWVKESFPGRAWIAVELLVTGRDSEKLASFRELGKKLNLPLVAAGDVHMHVRERRPLQDTLTAIRHRLTLAEAKGLFYPNGERHLRSRRYLARLYPSELLRETVTIAERCNFSMDELRYEYPDEIVPAGMNAMEHLRSLTYAGAERRWPQGIPENAKKQIEHELALITELKYEPYFLTVYDIVNFARRQRILCQGRGSAANSVVCFCLGITELDPERRPLLFERFMSRERQEPPDIDVDFEHERREEVIQYLYQKYGRDRAAIAATLITYRPKSVARDLGRVLGLDTQQLGRLSKVLRWADGDELGRKRLREAGLDPEAAVMRQFRALGQELLGYPRHLSQHVGGFVMSRGPLCQLVPIENAAMPDRTVIQWDKDDLDALGLLKVDVLALGELTALRKCLDMVNGMRETQYTLSTIPPEDPATYQMIQKADTVGTFQIESRAQMAMLPLLKPESLNDLVIEIALIRPGPIQGKVVHPYLARRRGEELPVYPSEAVKTVLERTLGVVIFQEQVMQLAVVAAGFTPGEADQLRRAMAAWRRTGNLGPFQEKLVKGLRAHGYSEDFARQIYNQVKGFGEYGFPESHAASFALLAYASAWLKRHEPAAYTCALLNSQPMGFYEPRELVDDVRQHGIVVRWMDVTRSDWHCTLEDESTRPQPAIRLGMRMIKGFSEVSAKRVMAAQPFSSMVDLAHKANLDRRDLALLAGSGACNAFTGDRYRAQWEALGVEPPLALDLVVPQEPTPLLAPPNEAGNIVADYSTVGLTLERHPMSLLRPHLTRMKLADFSQVRKLPNGARIRTAGLVAHRQQPESAKGTTFVTLEDETGKINVIVWPWLGARQWTELTSALFMEVTGTVQKEGDVLHLIASRLGSHDRLLGRLDHRSRDFH